MSSLRFAIALTLAVTTGAAAYAQGTPQQRSACRGDVARFCKGMQETGVIHSCLQQNYSRISAKCQKVLSGG